MCWPADGAISASHMYEPSEYSPDCFKMHYLTRLFDSLGLTHADLDIA